MTPLEYAILFVVIGLILLVAEIFLPSHATLAAGGAISFLVAVACCFGISTRAGYIALGLFILLSPIVTIAMLQLWIKSPLGQRLTLHNTKSSHATSPSPTLPNLQPGDLGTTITALRPTGLCDFNGTRVEATSDLGPIPTQTPIIVISLTDHRPTVRQAPV